MMILLPLMGQVVLLALAGSPHCVGMCGPLIAAGGRGARSDALWFFAGRATTYTALGVLAGALGAWIGWRGAGARVPGAAALVAYALCTAVASVGFVRSGYGVVAIAGCTLVSGFWLWSAAALVGRMPRLQDPLGAVPLGVVASLACVPPIALFLRSDPALAHGFVATFLSGLLLVVIVPSTLAGCRISAGPWPFLLVAGCLGALHLGVAPHPVTQVGLFAYAGLLLAPVLAKQLPAHARVVWALVAAGLAAMAIGLIPPTRAVGLGAIHFLILGPVMATLAPRWMRRPPPAWAWWCGHATWGFMSAALVAQGFVPAPWTWTAAAIGGTAAALWWAVVLASQVSHPWRVAATQTGSRTTDR